MLVIPAIDILEGKCVRLRQGRFDESTVFYDDPAAVAKQWARQGAQFLHVVDLEGARTGRPQALGHLRRIAKVGLPVQIGGGMRSAENIEAALAAGATRVIIGSRIAGDAAFAEETIKTFGKQVVMGIDAREGMVAVHGWEKLTSRRAIDLAKEMEQLGAAGIIFTDISRDGMLSGPNFESLAEMTAAVQIPIIASGGITCLEDIQRLRETRVEACIIGRALYSGDIRLPEAIRAG
ncbi:MAG: 1-(5-phosphoribosyl)-5-[(5-phosphoribosylamino)methylideneamino]imidazole-4-carboxamide isomerase, partial [Armatimonadetes bacterium]|nr:1-(5-phosphoribosyl)-5-[(5-phosphoribosylamino)methylideneamino]imidazole-4-carboxamide isomerase [Armatimonadota bacterium]NIM24925.1 1-(5-phosphoribosyl)-5-[(5-phosphoribosylamino)methylideneamino]imidazole-4-carboxamide isomerase [Armatimonadota bacterium]NIM68814.1 1-(5-phosphoribosyl)-5-[(5-phosphoribosylamino)methylideneamino]imidazole-4-carboxamide isomerase [Armatimonadota bacterium]NIM77061.1 1-(5-phosphoribosyl)-5-[(5-phosphoribosylamino)methylideneamino]imidazole-4-carboxamide isom